MYINEVLPFAKSIPKEHLSYFSSKKIEIGSIVEIEIRKRIVPGIVLTCTLATSSKSDLKNKDFALKKIKKVLKTTPFRMELCAAARRAADHFATFPSNILNTIIPKSMITDINDLPSVQKIKKKKVSQPSSEKYVIQDTQHERESHYRNIIRNSFVHHESVMIICPTIEDVLRLSESLSRGIESQTYTLHSKMSPVKIKKTWKECVTTEKPTVIICTPTFTTLPRHDFGAIIIEKESASSYTTIKRPTINITYIIEQFAKEMSVKIYRGDTLLTLHTINGLHNDEYVEYTPARFRFLTSAESSLIQMKGTESEKKEFKLLSPELEHLISKTHEDNEHLFIFTARTGLASSIVCGDCGTMVTCSWCSNPMVLHGNDATDKSNTFRCHSCGEERDAGELCTHCNSWKLKTLGVGTEGVHAAVSEIIPKQNVFLLDSNHIKTQTKARKLVAEYMKTPGSVLVGTEMALLYLQNQLEHIAVASIDSLFSIPNFDMREKIMRVLLQLRDIAQQTFIVQTRKKDEPLFEHALRGNSAEFVRSELSDREKFNYPPFAIIIKITGQGNKHDIEGIFEELQKFLLPHELVTFSAFTEEVRGQHIMNGIIRLKPEQWPNANLLQKLRTLPPYLKIVVDAQSLL